MILVFDVGTTAVKGALFNREGHFIAMDSYAVSLDSSQDANVHEIDPQQWMDGLVSITSSLLKNRSSKVEAIAISGNGPTLVSVDTRGKPLAHAMTWLDRRGTEETEILMEKNGIYIDPAFFLPKALWIARNQPEIYERTKHFMACPEFVVFSLTGEVVMTFPGEGLEHCVWTTELIQSVDLDLQKFPSLVEAGDLVGHLTAEAANLLGIEKEIPVFTGGADFMMALLGTASVWPGMACDRAGTSEGINICTQTRIEDPNLLCYRHVNRDYWNISGVISTSGKALEWFKQHVYADDRSYESMFQQLAAVKKGSEKLIFLPYLAGERAPIWDPKARGVFLGLTLGHGTAEMGHAVLESVGYAIRDVIAAIEEHGIQVKELRVAGNPSKSELWNQVKADITGVPILIPEIEEAELTGDLCVAQFGLKEYASLPEAADQLVEIKKTYHPENDSAAVYDELFGIYRESYQALKGVFSDLANIQT